MFSKRGIKLPEVCRAYVVSKIIGFLTFRMQTSRYATFRTSPPRTGLDLIRMPLSAPSIVRSETSMSLTPPTVSLPIDMPWPRKKWLCAIVMRVDGPLAPALIATLSSPVLIQQRVIVTFVDPEGSMPSVLRAPLPGAHTFTPQAVKPFVLLTITWKFGELRMVIRYNVKLSASSATTMRKLF